VPQGSEHVPKVWAHSGVCSSGLFGWVQEIIHRDVKPDNLLLTASPALKVSDFGLARVEGTRGNMTNEMGTYRLDGTRGQTLVLSASRQIVQSEIKPALSWKSRHRAVKLLGTMEPGRVWRPMLFVVTMACLSEHQPPCALGVGADH